MRLTSCAVTWYNRYTKLGKGDDMELKRIKEIAWAAGTDAGERSRRSGGRCAWNQEDLAAASSEYNRILDELTVLS